MPVVVAILIAVVLRLSTTGTLRLDGLTIRGESWMIGAFLAVAALPTVSHYLQLPRVAVLLAWLFSMVLLLVVALANARHVSGFGLVALGVALNVAVILVNGGMPVFTDGLSAGSAGRLSSDLFHVAGYAGTRLPLLGDVIPLPGPAFLRSLLSPGDVVMLLGVVVVLVAAMPRRQEASEGTSLATAVRIERTR